MTGADINTDNVRWNLDRGAVLTETEARLMCGEINSLRARLAEVEAERDLATESARRAYADTADMAERLAEVEAERDSAVEKLDSARNRTCEWHTCCGEVTELGARLAEVEAERQGWESDFRDMNAAHTAAEARLAEVLAVCDDPRNFTSPGTAIAKVRRAAAAGRSRSAEDWCRVCDKIHPDIETGRSGEGDRG